MPALHTHTVRSQEVADIMTEFYELLAETGHYNESIIKRPPHHPGINKALAAELELSPEAVDMMELLPYLNLKDYPIAWSKGGGDNEFLLSGTFADLRDDGEVVGQGQREKV